MGRMTDDGYVPSKKEMVHGYYDGDNHEIHRMSQMTKRELIEKALGDEEMCIKALIMLEWVFGAFVHTLDHEMGFGRKRVRKALDGVRRRLARYTAFDQIVDDPHLRLFDNYLEDKYKYRYYISGGRILLRDLESPRDYDDLGPGLKVLEWKVTAERYDLLTDYEWKVLETLREANPPAWESVPRKDGEEE